MAMVIAGALALMLVMVWYFYRLGRSNGREQGKRWARQNLKEIRETRDLSVKRLREVQVENHELRRKWEVPTDNATVPPPEERTKFGTPTRADRVQMMERTIRKDSVQKKLGRHSPPPPPPPPPARVMTPRGVSLGLDLYPTSHHHHDIDPTGIIGAAVLHSLSDDAVERVQTPSYEAPSYEPPCSSSSSDYSSDSTDFGCSDTSSSSSGSGDW